MMMHEFVKKKFMEYEVYSSHLENRRELVSEDAAMRGASTDARFIMKSSEFKIGLKFSM